MQQEDTTNLAAGCDPYRTDGMQGHKGRTVIVYARPEDEFYHKHCSWSYSFPVSGKVVQKDELQPLRLVMLLSPDQAAAARYVRRQNSRSWYCVLFLQIKKA